MLGDAIKRLEYVLKQNQQALYAPDGEPTEAYWILFETIQVMLLAIGQDNLARKLERDGASSRALLALTTAIREIGTTPFDKLIPWTYREIARAYKRSNPRDVDELKRRAAAIMQWQAATRTDINKLTAEQVFDAVDKWESAPRRAKQIGKIIYQFRDGWTVQQLDTDAALKEEGRLMKHCVGGYCEQVAAGTSAIFSLRDSNNVPRITMEWNPKAKHFVQIHGPENDPPTLDVRPYLIEVIEQVFGGEPLGLLILGVPAKDLDLRGANLTRADLSGANLTHADLSGANLINANLTRADLSGANLTHADLSGADLSGANLTRANLINANLSGADLSDADLSGANLINANLTRAYLSGANLTRANLINANLSGADLTRADLSGANLTHADLSGADLSGANLTHADLSGANLRYAYLTRADLSGANLTRANLSGANLRGANLTHADLSGANLRGAKFNENTIMPDGSYWSPAPAGFGRWH